MKFENEMRNCNIELSVIIPAYNVSASIIECIMSVLRQANENIEIIVVDDGSSDNTLILCENLAKDYSMVKVYHQANAGVSAARNHGIRKSTGKWITFLDGDDELQIGSLEKIDFHSDCDLILCAYRTKKILEQPKLKSYLEKTHSLDKFVLNYPEYRKYIRIPDTFDSLSKWSCWGKLFKRKIIVNNKIEFPLGITHGEDLVFCYYYYHYVKKVLWINTILYFYYLNPRSVTHKFNANRIENTENLFRAIKKMDLSIVQSQDYNMFVVNRLIACCRLYFANNENPETNFEKVKKLSYLCNKPEYCNAINKCNIFKLSTGRTTRIKIAVIALFLKIKMFKAAILFSRLFK